MITQQLYLLRRRMESVETTSESSDTAQASEEEIGTPAPSAPHAFLPPDIFLQFLDHLEEDDLVAVRRCMLTCKVWYQLARPYAYRIISIDMSSQQSNRFLDVLDADPEIAALVKELRLSCPRSPPWIWSDPAMRLLSQRLHSVRTLEFTDLGGHLSVTDILYFTTIKTLRLRKMQISADVLLEVLARLPDLSALELMGTILEISRPGSSTAVEEPEDSACTPSLRRIIFELGPVVWQLPSVTQTEIPLLTWLTQSESRWTLRSVVIRIAHFPFSPSAADVGRFLAALSPNVEELVLTPPTVTSWDAILARLADQPIKLSHLTGLRRLQLGAPGHPGVMSILSSSLPSLQQIAFQVHFGAGMEGTHFGSTGYWQRMHEPLDIRLCSNRDFPSLQTVQIRHGGEHVVIEAFRNAFPRIRERGMLSFVAT